MQKKKSRNQRKIARNVNLKIAQRRKSIKLTVNKRRLCFEITREWQLKVYMNAVPSLWTS